MRKIRDFLPVQKLRKCREIFDMRKRGQVWETLAPWIIAIVVLVLMVILYQIITGKGTGALEYFKNLWRFGR